MYRALTVSLALLLSLLMGHSAAARQVIHPYYDQGVFAYEDGDYPAAETAFRKALDFDPDNPSISHFLGKTYIQMARYQKARPHVEKAWQADPDLPGLAFDRAFLYYKLAEYVRAAKLFQTVLAEDPSRVMADFYCGVSLYRDRQYRQANSHLLAAAGKSPDLKVKAYYFSGLCHYHMNQQNQALERMKYVQANTDSAEVRANTDRWIDTITRGKKERQPYRLELLLAYEYDDNVPLEPTDHDDLYSEEQDSLILAYAAGEYDFVSQQTLALGAGVSRFQTWHFELDEYDSSETAGKLYGRYKIAPFTVGLQLGPGLYQLDGEDYLLTTEVKPDFSYAAGGRHTLWISYTYAVNDFRQSEYDDRDGTNHEFFFDDVYRLKNDKGFLLGGFGYEVNRAEKEEHEYDRLAIRVGGSCELPHMFVFGVWGNYAVRNYVGEDPLGDKTRKDNRYKLTMSLTRELYYPWLEVAAEFTYTRNDSNISDYEYTRQIAGFGVRATF